MSAKTWTVAEAKAKFSDVIERAQSCGPQTITRNGRRVVVVVAAEEWEHKTKRTGNLAEFFAASPLRGSGMKARRIKDRLLVPLETRPRRKVLGLLTGKLRVPADFNAPLPADVIADFDGQ